MDWKLHLIVPLIIFGVIVALFSVSLEFAVAALIVLFISSLLPDLDHPKSIMRYIVVSTVFFLMMIFLFVYIPSDFMVKIIVIGMLFILFFVGHKKLPVNHRGEKSLHLWRYAIIFSFISMLILIVSGSYVALALIFFIGYSTHLLMDKIKKF